MGAFAGVAVAIIGVIVWAILTATTKYQSGWMALGVGAPVGFALRIGMAEKLWYFWDKFEKVSARSKEREWPPLKQLGAK
jgi:hypothetical protein